MYQLIQVGISHLKSKTKSPTYKETLANYVEVIKMDGSFAWLFNCMVCSGFIMSGVFTEVVNVAVESGVPKEWAANLILFSAGPEVRLISY